MKNLIFILTCCLLIAGCKSKEEVFIPEYWLKNHTSQITFKGKPVFIQTGYIEEYVTRKGELLQIPYEYPNGCAYVQVDIGGIFQVETHWFAQSKVHSTTVLNYWLIPKNGKHYLVFDDQSLEPFIVTGDLYRPTVSQLEFVDLIFNPSRKGFEYLEVPFHYQTLEDIGIIK